MAVPGPDIEPAARRQNGAGNHAQTIVERTARDFTNSSMIRAAMTLSVSALCPHIEWAPVSVDVNG